MSFCKLNNIFFHLHHSLSLTMTQLEVLSFLLLVFFFSLLGRGLEELLEVGSDLRCAIFREQIWRLRPVLSRSVLLEILPIVHVIDLPIGWVLPWVEIGSPMLDFVLFAILAHGSLLLLEEVLVVSGRLHVAIFERTLIWAPAGVGRGDLIVQPGREVIHLEGEVRHSIHHLGLLRVWGFAPDHFNFALRWQHSLKENIRIPIACNKHARIRCLFLLSFDFIAYLTFELGYILILSEPSTSMEVNYGLLLAI